MHYYIDGYNLMFRVLRAGDDLQKQREKIIKDLQAKIQLLALNATLVFDAHYQENEAQRFHIHPLEILFTAKGETADEAILRLLKAAPKPEQCTVVTSDKRLAWAARRRSAKTESVEEFLEWLNKRFHNKLRRLKQAKETSPPPQLKKQKARQEREPGTSVEESFDYYLEIFERELGKQKPIKKDDALSDMARWLKAFEKEL